jgi:hypothetical protein
LFSETQKNILPLNKIEIAFSNFCLFGVAELNDPVNVNPNDQLFIHGVITDISEEQPDIPILQNVNRHFKPEEDQLIFKYFMEYEREWKNESCTYNYDIFMDCDIMRCLFRCNLPYLF